MEGFSSHAPISARFERRFKAKSVMGDVMPFADFMELALYDHEVGYYPADRERVGREPSSDFYTASSFQPVFGRLVVAATIKLLAERAASDFTFVEIGAEPGRCVLDEVKHPFAAVVVIRPGDPLAIPPQSVVFSNELFDAQPFHRVVWQHGAWRELGVRCSRDELGWSFLDQLSPDVEAIAARLPDTAPECYTLDLPIRAEHLATAIAAKPWEGVFIAFDYGRTWRELVSDYPHGTGRAYAAHRQSGDLLRTPGQQDLTCHICWDWMEDTLTMAGFETGNRLSQESFFMRHAQSAVEDILRSGQDPLSAAHSQMRGLLHAGLMGQKFEVLTTSRSSA